MSDKWHYPWYSQFRKQWRPRINTRCHERGTRCHIKRRESTRPRYVVTRRARREPRARLAQRWSADRNCFSPIRRHYHAPSCSNGSVKCQTGNSVLLCPALRSAPTVAKTLPPPSVLPLPLRASPFPQRCDCAAKLWLLFLLVSVPSLHRLRSPSFFWRREKRGAREHFSSRVS